MNGKKSTSAVKTSRIFTNKDIHCLEYFSGYCFGEMYRKLRKSRSSQSEVCLQWLSILLAAKTENDQKLVDENAVNISKHCEQEFRKWTAECGHQIDSKLITKHIIENSIIRVNFASITDTSDQKIDREIAKNLLPWLVSLYIRARTFSYAKNIKESHKDMYKSIYLFIYLFNVNTIQDS